MIRVVKHLILKIRILNNEDAFKGQNRRGVGVVSLYLLNAKPLR